MASMGEYPEDIPALSIYGVTHAEMEEWKRENELRAYIRWESKLLEDCEITNAYQEAWVEFARQCDAEYQARKEREEWIEVKKRVPRPKKEPQDLSLVCRDCGREFVFTVNEQEKFKSRSWDQPKTCVSCILYRNS